ncbi:hypothetical protein [Oscillatoria salina]|uniref:hypothetical protein n=1 Tax=Oscillatoria salina TaxID=331517 RepID=UPI0013B62B22|nr:hypothetical protein [Oscillatoria salina]MBZ8181941.1 hypothetical protein [Oscillatoria salina IIICB1]NET89161.1 hypothetical protein [Kamptonema sp. SIO1D9]
MLHLAQVQKNPTSGTMELELLAYRKEAENLWEIGAAEGFQSPIAIEKLAIPIASADTVSLAKEYFQHEGLLVLVEMSGDREIISVKEAKDWLVGLVQKYLSRELLTPEFLEQEEARVEQWRQDLTQQSQELTRRNLEIETRQEQIQQLEENLKLEKEKFEQEKEKFELSLHQDED